MIVKVVVAPTLRSLLNHRICNYLVKCPHLHTFGFQVIPAVGTADITVQVSTTCYKNFSSFVSAMPLSGQAHDDFENQKPIILNYAIKPLDGSVFHNNSTRYSCCCYQLTERSLHPSAHTQLAKLRPFPYGVTLGTTGCAMSRLPTRAPFLMPPAP